MPILIFETTPLGLVTEFTRAVGEELRRARQEAGLALRDLGQRSQREFKASAVGGYERGERSISVDRFCRLAALYGVSPDQLLARVVQRISRGDRGDVVIDIRSVSDAEPSTWTIEALAEDAPARRPQIPPH